MLQPIDLPDGYYTVPAGKLVNAVTWLEMRAAPSTPIAVPLVLQPVTDAEVDDCRQLFATIGTPWLWSRAAGDFSGESLTRDTFFALDDGMRVGIVAFERSLGPDVEITWFGLTPDATGQGLGRRMMAAALEMAWASGPDRIWLHTCNFDHPSAIRFYRSCGFVPYATGFEIMGDPRLTGLLPRTAAPHVALIETPNVITARTR